MATGEFSPIDSSGVGFPTPEEMPTVTTGKDGKKRQPSTSRLQALPDAKGTMRH